MDLPGPGGGLTCVPGLSDAAKLARASPCPGAAMWPSTHLTVSALRRTSFRRSITPPACAATDASFTPTMHGSRTRCAQDFHPLPPHQLAWRLPCASRGSIRMLLGVGVELDRLQRHPELDAFAGRHAAYQTLGAEPLPRAGQRHQTRINRVHARKAGPDTSASKLGCLRKCAVRGKRYPWTASRAPAKTGRSRAGNQAREPRRRQHPPAPAQARAGYARIRVPPLRAAKRRTNGVERNGMGRHAGCWRIPLRGGRQSPPSPRGDSRKDSRHAGTGYSI